MIIKDYLHKYIDTFKGTPGIERWRVFVGLVLYLLLSTWFVHFFLSQSDNGDYSSLILFGERFEERSLSVLKRIPHQTQPGSGYDGQFYAQLALSPFFSDPELKGALDSHAYRGRRVLFPLLAYSLGGGDPENVLQAYALLNVLCWVLLGVLMIRWFPPMDIGNIMRWMGCMFAFGLFKSCHRALLDGPSMLLFAAAVAALEAARPRLSVGIVAISGLGKETNLLAAVIFPFREGFRGKSVAQAVRILLSVLWPLGLWGVYLWFRNGQVLNPGHRNLTWPLAGYISKLGELLSTLSGELDSLGSWLTLGCLLGISVQAVYLISRMTWSDPWWRLGSAYVGLMLILGPAVWEGDPGAYVRVLTPVAFAFNVLLDKTRKSFLPLWLAGNLSLWSTSNVILS